MSSTREPTIPTARFGAQQRKGVLLGFSGPRLLVIATALAVTVGALFSRGLPGLLLVLPIHVESRARGNNHGCL